MPEQTEQTPGQKRRYLMQAVRAALRHAVKRGTQQTQIALWAGKSPQTIHNWCREQNATTPDAASLLVLCSNAEGPLRDELLTVIQKAMPELEVVEPVGSEDRSAGAP